jgi:hypothetical protein
MEAIQGDAAWRNDDGYGAGKLEHLGFTLSNKYPRKGKDCRTNPEY